MDIKQTVKEYSLLLICSLIIFGVLWDAERDILKFKVITKGKPAQKGGFYQLTSLGSVCPVVLGAKGIMQRLWKLKISSDYPLQIQNCKIGK